MSRVETLKHRINVAIRAIEKRFKYWRLPYIVCDESGATLPEYLATEQEARTRGVNVKVYGFDPDIDGSEL
jgi:hypothetical protein